MTFRRCAVNPILENEILTALITSSYFCANVRQVCRPEYFFDYGKIICQWVYDYWDAYKEVPGKRIESIYAVENKTLSLAISQAIATYLEGLSTAYEENTQNISYLIEKTLDWSRNRAYEVFFDTGRELISAGRTDDAISLHEAFKDVAKCTLPWENSFDVSMVVSHFNDIDSHGLFSFDGALGELVGPMKRGWLVAFLGPMKRGKSYWIQETMFRAATAKKRVAYVNLEMLGRDIRDREYARLIGCGKYTPDKVRFPVFDCKHNQYGTCPVKNQRTNDINLFTSDREKPVFGSPGHGDYRVCTACRDVPDYSDYYVPDVWYIWHQPKSYTEESVKHAVKGFVRQYGDRIRQISYPAYSVTIDEIRRDINSLIWTEGFYPDVVCIDYADIVASKTMADNERAHINHVWKQMKGAAVEMDALWVTGSQTNRGAFDKEVVDQKDVAEDIRKLAHVDVMLGINQTNDEKRELKMRMTCLAHRHKPSDFYKQVMVLQQLELGMPYIDSAFVR